MSANGNERRNDDRDIDIQTSGGGGARRYIPYVAAGTVAYLGYRTLSGTNFGDVIGGEPGAAEEQNRQEMEDTEEYLERLNNDEVSREEASEKADEFENKSLTLAEQYPKCKEEVEQMPYEDDGTFTIEEGAYERDAEDAGDTPSPQDRSRYWANIYELLLACQRKGEGWADGIMGAISDVISDNSLIAVLGLIAAGAVAFYGGAIAVAALAVFGAAAITASSIESWLSENFAEGVKNADEIQQTETEIDDFDFTEHGDEEPEYLEEETGDGVTRTINGSFRGAIATLETTPFGEDVVKIATEAEKQIPYTVSTDLVYNDDAVQAIADPLPVSPSYFEDRQDEGIVMAWAFIAALSTGSSGTAVIQNALDVLPEDTDITSVDNNAVPSAASTITENIEEYTSPTA